MKGQRGITLVALVITIIVLIILSGITISFVVNGELMSKARYAIDKHGDEELLELFNMARLEYQMKKIYNMEQSELEYVQGSLSDTFNSEVIITKMGKGYKIKFIDKNVVYRISSEGRIMKYEEMDTTKVYARLDDEGILYLRATKKDGYNVYSTSSSITANWNTAGTANRECVTKVIIEEKIAPNNMRNMFYNCINLTSIENMENLHTENVTDMSYCFYLCNKMKNIDVSMWDTCKVKNMSGLFNRCRIVEALDVDEFNTSNVTNMTGMFVECSKVSYLDVSEFDTVKVTNMSSMFSSCSGLEKLDVSKFNTSQVTNMSDMFYCCTKLLELDVSNFDTSKVTNTSKMFNRCRNVLALDVSGFNTSQVTNMSTMFYECSKVKQLDVSKFDTSQVTNMSSMFGACGSLVDLNMGNSFVISDNANIDKMFSKFNIIKIKATQNIIDKLKNAFTSFKDNNFIIVN